MRGKVCTYADFLRHCKDHPRLCGEKPPSALISYRVIGSPPPMRGKVDNDRRRNKTAGITPAYAGKRGRVCAFLPQTVGSPPPMRGKAKAKSCEKTDAGITPAYAGKSLTGTVWTKPPRDHPRLCGEKGVKKAKDRAKTGSPPPMRGKVATPPPMDFARGITPAYAGKRDPCLI